VRRIGVRVRTGKVWRGDLYQRSVLAHPMEFIHGGDHVLEVLDDVSHQHRVKMIAGKRPRYDIQVMDHVDLYSRIDVNVQGAFDSLRTASEVEDTSASGIGFRTFASPYNGRIRKSIMAQFSFTASRRYPCVPLFEATRFTRRRPSETGYSPVAACNLLRNRTLKMRFALRIPITLRISSGAKNSKGR
jgi:hypothetical protein